MAALCRDRLSDASGRSRSYLTPCISRLISGATSSSTQALNSNPKLKVKPASAVATVMPPVPQWRRR